MKTAPILVVDDEATNLGLLDAILGDTWPVIAAKNGREALAAAAKHRPALILLDVRMPDMDGFTVCSHLKANPETRDIPVIFVTSMGEIWDEASGFLAGGVDYIVKPPAPETVKARVRTHLSLTRVAALEKSYLETVNMLTEVGHRNDSDTGFHAWRMAAYARAIAEEAGWDQEEARMLEIAAPLHDTGKIGIPERILRKPGKLDENERELMKSHSRIGWEILSKNDAPLFQMAAEIALHHHERWDGAGYPDGLSGEGISPVARIVALADVFDALASKRPYKEPWPMEHILETISEGAASHFDPRYTKAFHDGLPRILELKEQWECKESEPEYQTAWPK